MCIRDSALPNAESYQKPICSYQPQRCCDDNLIWDLGLTLGYANVEPGTNEGLIDSVLLSPLINQLLNTQNQSGGFGFRVFGNGLAPINSWASIGAELTHGLL